MTSGASLMATVAEIFKLAGSTTHSLVPSSLSTYTIPLFASYRTESPGPSRESDLTLVHVVASNSTSVLPAPAAKTFLPTGSVSTPLQAAPSGTSFTSLVAGFTTTKEVLPG